VDFDGSPEREEVPDVTLEEKSLRGRSATSPGSSVMTLAKKNRCWMLGCQMARVWTRCSPLLGRRHHPGHPEISELYTAELMRVGTLTPELL
jgi:hypothetical protein